MKKVLSLALTFAMILSMLYEGNLGFGINAKAASNSSSTVEGNTEDVFSALGFDTSTTPKGYDATTTSNPYGRDKLSGNQVFEVQMATSGGTTLYGNNNNNVLPSSITGYSSGGAAMPSMKLYAGAAGDFNGDGLPGETAYVGLKSLNYASSTASDLCLYVYDSATNTYSSAITLGQVSPYYTISDSSNALKQTYMDASWQNLLQISTGDYDGDGISEIAVYIAQSGNARIDIYKYQKTSSAPGNAWLTIGNWSRVWSYAVSASTNSVPNMVSLVSGDFNQDGVDDLGLSYGRAVYYVGNSASLTSLLHDSTYTYSGLCLESDVSKARILWGGTSGMLQANSALDLGSDALGSLIRVSLTYGDVDADRKKDLIMAGEPLSDKNANYQRAVGIYVYDGSGLVLNTTQIVKVVDTENQSIPVYDGNGKPTGGTTTNTVSKNGYDKTNLSSPAMKCNVAVLTPDRSLYTYLYVDSAMCKYYETTLTLSYELDDSSSCDGGSTNTTLDWATTKNSDYYISNLFNTANNSNYCEYGAVSGDINGKGNQILLTSFVGTSNTENKGYDSLGFADSSYTGVRGSYKGYSVLYAGGSAGVTSHSVSTTGGSYSCLSPTAVAITMPDTDIDTTLIEYSGIHYLTYSDPKVLAVIAAAPYFKDVDTAYNNNYAWQNTTSWATTSGSGGSSLVSVDFEAGGYVAANATIFGYDTDIEASVGFTFEWEQEKSKTTEYTLQFQTSQDEDQVAFYCIPTECYVYTIYTPDGNGGYTSKSDIISNSFSPCYQVLSLDYYESIQGNYDVLPQITGKAITSTPGDPSSYPSSTSGYNVIAAWNEDPAGVSFGNGSISQQITLTDEETNTYNFGANVEFKIGFGSKSWADIGQSGATIGGGAYFSINPAGGFSTVNISGTTITGVVTNMPTEFQDYGYYYTWKLFSYAYKFSDGTSVPVVSYVVGDVSQPPKLPTDFKQDYSRTTSDTNCLTWTCSGSPSTFYLYKYCDFPEGGGMQKIATIGAGNASNYTIKYDLSGKAYKEFYYLDKNLSDYTEYQYCVQVERSSPVPPLSSPSALLTARTKSSTGNPLLSITESDGKNDSALLVYPDKNAYLTVGVTGPDGQLSSNYYTTVQYQWQKLVSGVWTDQGNEASKTLTFESAGVSAAGDYRCRVNVLTKADAKYITSYTNAVTVTQSKRSTYISSVYAHDSSSGGIELFAQVVNAHADSATIPDGTVSFTLTSNNTGAIYQYAADMDSSGIASAEVDDALPQGTYSVFAYYSGSYIFKPCTAESLYLSDLSSGYAIDATDSVIYGDGGSLTFRQLSKSSGVTAATPVNAKDIYLYQADTATLSTISGAAAIAIGGTVAQGCSYKYTTDDGDVYFFTATRSGTVTQLSGAYVYYSATPVNGCLTESSSTGVYEIAESTPAGGYVIQMTASDGSAWASFTVAQREVTLQLPILVGSENTDEVYPTVGDLTVTSGSWASCDCTSGALNSGLVATSVLVTYTNTAGKTFDNTTVDATCGYYVTSHAISRTLLSNYKLSFWDGSVSILGATHTLLLGARAFEGGDVGTAYVVSPDVKHTRDALTYDSTAKTFSGSVSLNYQAGTRAVFYAVPDTGYEVEDWYVNGVAQNSNSTSFTFAMLAQDTRVEVQFIVKQNTLTFGTAGDKNGGTITCSDTSLTSGSVVISNSVFKFSAAANTGYHFKEWRYTKTGTGTSYDSMDSGKSTSQFDFTMPTGSCTLYAVFERDFYTLSLNDLSRNGGLTAYYYDTSLDSTASKEKTWVTGSASIKGNTQVVILPATGYQLDADYNYVSVGTQGTADYAAGTYTIKNLTENTTVTCSTKRQSYDVKLAFIADHSTAQPSDAAITCTAAGVETIYNYSDYPTGTTASLADVAGGSALTVSGSCASYYKIDGWENSLKSPVTAVTSSDFTPEETSWQSTATDIADGGKVTQSTVYRYTDSGSGKTYYFKAAETGKMLVGASPFEVHVIASGDSYAVSALGSAMTLTMYLTEKPAHKVTLGNITDGTYSYTLPEGATGGTDGDSKVVTLHDGDNLALTVAPASGKAVTYWTVSYTPSTTLLTSKYRATSLTYTLSDIAYDYTVTPVFAATTYNTVSWPTIGGTINGITLTPVGCLSSVASGSTFTFTLDGSTSALALIDKVYANGNELTLAGNSQDGSTYSYLVDSSTGIKTYSITNIIANQVITLSFNKIGVTVNGIDISAFTGTGWTYDASSQTLTISGNGRILSGTNNQAYGPALAIVLGTATGTVTLSDLNITSSVSGALVSSGRTTGISVTATGVNTLTENNTSTSSAILFYTANNLTVRGSGSLTLNLNGAGGKAPTKAVCCTGELFMTGTVNMTVNVPLAAGGNSGSPTNTVGVYCGDLLLGVQNSETSSPSLKVYMYADAVNNTFSGDYKAIGLLAANNDSTIWGGNLLVCAAYGLYAPYHYINNYGGSAELNSLYGAMYQAQYAYWLVNYSPSGASNPSGFLACYGTNDTSFTTATFNVSDKIELAGYNWNWWLNFLNLFGLKSTDKSPLESEYLKIAPATVSNPGITVTVTDPGATPASDVTATGTVQLSSGNGGNGTYYYYNDGGTLTAVSENAFNNTFYKNDTIFYAKYDNGSLQLQEFDLGNTTYTCTTYVKSEKDNLTYHDASPVTADQKVVANNWYFYTDGVKWQYFQPTHDGWVECPTAGYDYGATTVCEYVPNSMASPAAGDLTYTLSGVDSGLTVSSESAASVTLNGLTAKSLTVSDDCATFTLLGNNYLAGSVSVDGVLTLDCTALDIVSDGTGTLSAINAASGTAYGISFTSADAVNLKLINVKSLSAYGLTTGIHAANGYTVSYFDGTLSDAYGIYGYGWLSDVGTSSATATVRKGDLLNLTYISGLTNPYVRYYSTSAAADYSDALVYDENTSGTSALQTTAYCPAVGGKSHMFSTSDTTCTVKLADISGSSTPLASGTDYTWTQGQYSDTAATAAAKGVLALKTGTALNSSLAVGDYKVIVSFHDESTSDATYYTLEIPLTVENTHTSDTGVLSILPTLKTLSRGGSATFTTMFTGATPKTYIWKLDDKVISGATESAYTLNIASDAAFTGTSPHHLTVEAFSDAAASNSLGTATADITVAPQATGITISSASETPSGDGSFTLYHNNAGSWDFDASVVLDDGNTSNAVTWLLWGALMRKTTVNSSTGVVTLASNETGNNGKLRLTATYTNGNGSTYAKTVDIWLSSDAHVSYTSAGTNGKITGVVYGIAQNKISESGAWIPSGSTVTATAATGTEYTVSHWYVNGVSVMNNSSYTISPDGKALTFTAASMGAYVITADYININNFIITYTVGDNGSISAVQNGAAFTSGSTVLKDTAITFTAVPNTYYQVKCWYVDGAVYRNPAGTTYTGTTMTLSAIEANHTVSVAFEGVPITVTFVAGINSDVSTASPNGIMSIFDDGTALSAMKVTGSDNSLTYTATVNAYSAVNIFANPSSGYQVKGWYVWNGSSYDEVASSAEIANYYSASLTSSLYVKAEFEPLPTYTVTASVDSYENGGGTVVRGINSVSTSGSIGITVNRHKTLTLLAAADTGSYLYDWRVTAGASYTKSGDSITLTDITGNVSVAAVFRKAYYGVSLTSGAGGTMPASYNLTGIDYNGTIADGGRADLKSGSTVVATITPESGYKINSLTVNGTKVDYAVSGTPGNYTYTYTIGALLADTDISVTFEACEFFDVTSPSTTAYNVNVAASGTDDYAVAGTVTTSFVNDGFSGDADTADNKVEILAGGSAILTITPNFGTAAGGTDYDFAVNVTNLRNAVLSVLTAAHSNASYSIYINGGSYCVALTGIDTSLDFSALAIPFEKNSDHVTLRTVTFSSTGNGTISAEYGGISLFSGAHVPDKASVVFTMTSAAHNALDTLTENADNVLGSATESGSSYTYTAVLSGDTAVSATYEVSEYYVSINLCGTGSGKVTAAGGSKSITSCGYLPAGSSISVTASANTGSTFNCMAVNGVPTGASYTLTKLSTDANIVTVFDATAKTVTYNTPSNGILTVTDSSGNTIASGASVAVGTVLVITPTPNTHYALDCLTAGGTAVSGNTYIVDAAKANSIQAAFAIAEVPVTWTDTTGGKISAFDSNGAAIANGTYVSVGAVILIRADVKDSNYELVSLNMNGTAITSGRKYTVPATAVTLTAAFDYVGDLPDNNNGGGGGGGSGGSSGSAINVMTTDGALTAQGTVTTTNSGLTITIDNDSFVKFAAHSKNTGSGVIVNSTLAAVVFNSKAVAFINSVAGKENVNLQIDRVAASTLSSENRKLVGDHPVYDFSLNAGNIAVKDFGGGKATISIPYTLQADETAESVVVYYIDDNGVLQIVRGAYSATTKKVTFVVAHLSEYAFASNSVKFSDVEKTDWYYKPVTFIAAREITLGIGNNLYGPDNRITRGEFLVMLMRSYGIEADANPTSNFTDAGDTYYTSYLAAAMRLRITNGIGDNKYAPDAYITRQDMFVLLYRALDVLGELPKVSGTANMTTYPDSAQIADYAQEAFKTFVSAGVVSGSDKGTLNPTAFSTRSEMAQILYNLLSV